MATTKICARCNSIQPALSVRCSNCGGSSFMADTRPGRLPDGTLGPARNTSVPTIPQRGTIVDPLKGSGS